MEVSPTAMTASSFAPRSLRSRGSTLSRRGVFVLLTWEEGTLADTHIETGFPTSRPSRNAFKRCSRARSRIACSPRMPSSRRS
jgi:hypothetical protein